MAYTSTSLDTEIEIEELYTIHYFEYQKKFHFEGESHDFWEFQCVDKGEAEVETDRGLYLLGRGQVIFHKPNEFHAMAAAGETAPNIAVVSFVCHSPAMSFFENQLLTLSESERALIGMIIAEGRRCLASPLDDPYLQKMEKRKDAMFGAQQLLRLYLEQFLILLIRRYTLPHPRMSMAKAGDKAPAVYHEILYYLEENLRKKISVEEICQHNLVSRSQLHNLFQEQNGCGVIDFFLRMKVEYAKQLIRENQMNFTQIAAFLGYSSIQYFSRQFKEVSGMTPSEYSSSIKAHAEEEKE